MLTVHRFVREPRPYKYRPTGVKHPALHPPPPPPPHRRRLKTCFYEDMTWSSPSKDDEVGVYVNLRRNEEPKPSFGEEAPRDRDTPYGSRTGSSSKNRACYRVSWNCAFCMVVTPKRAAPRQRTDWSDGYGSPSCGKNKGEGKRGEFDQRYPMLGGACPN